jgi:hypothetical protein
VPAETFVTSSLDKVLGQSRVEPRLDPRTVPETSDLAVASEPPTTSEVFGKPYESGDLRAEPENLPRADSENLPPGPGAPPPVAEGRRTAAAKFPAGILFYLAFLGVVAATTIGVFFGIGFFLLTQPSNAVTGVTAGSDRDRRDSKVNAQPSDVSPRRQSDKPSAEPAAAPGLADTPVSRSAATAVLPAAPLAQPPAAGEPASARDSKAPPASAPVSRDGAAPGTTPRSVVPGAEAPAPASATKEAASIAPPAPGEAGAVEHTQSTAKKGKHNSHARSARHGRHHRSRQQAAPQAASGHPVVQSITPPHPGQPDPFAQRSPSR